MRGATPHGFAVAASVLLALLALTYRAFRSRHRFLGLLRLTWSHARRGFSVPEDELKSTVCAQMLRRKVEQYQCLVLIVSFLLLPIQAQLIANFLRDIPRCSTLMQDAIAVAAQSIATVSVLRPQYITVRSLDVYYVAMMLCAALYITPYSCNTCLLPRALLVSNLAMATLNFFRRTVASQKAPVFLLSNLFFTLCAISTITVNGEALFEKTYQVATWQICVVCVCSLGPHLLEEGFRATVHQSLQLEETRELHAAACALLHSFCECTVELDGDGRITGSSEDLGSYLMKGHSYSLRGTRLVDLVVQEERAQLEERLALPPMRTQLGLAECMPVSMRDGCGNLLRLELLWFLFRRGCGRQHRMVGFREISDRLHRPSRLSDDAVAPGRSVQEDSFSEAKLDEGQSVTSNEPMAAILVVNILEEGFPIRAQSPALAAQIGRLPTGALLADYVRSPQGFMAWVQRMSMLDHPGSSAVVLSLPWGHFRAECQVLLQSSLGSESATETCLEQVGLHLTQISALQRPGRSLRGTPRASHSDPGPGTASL